MMSIMEHLDELKKRMIRVFLLALVLSIISLFFYKQIFDFFIVNIESIIQDNGGVIAIQRITEGWVVAAKLAITFGVMLTLPYFLRSQHVFLRLNYLVVHKIILYHYNFLPFFLSFVFV